MTEIQDSVDRMFYDMCLDSWFFRIVCKMPRFILRWWYVALMKEIRINDSISDHDGERLNVFLRGLNFHINHR